MKQELTKFSTIAMSPLLIISLCSPAKADFGMIAAQNATYSMNQTLQSANYRILTEQSLSTQRRSSSESNNSSSENQQSRSSGAGSNITSSSNPEISRQVKNNIISKISDPKSQKFLSQLLTLQNAKEIFSAIYVDSNNIVDVYTVGSLYSFKLIEGKGPINKEQVRTTRKIFTKVFDKLGVKKLDNASLQRARENMLYWTILMAYSESKAGENPQEIEKIKASASSYMASTGLNPQKFTLTSSGFKLR
jgi:hypothetical protein